MTRTNEEILTLLTHWNQHTSNPVTGLQLSDLASNIESYITTIIGSYNIAIAAGRAPNKKDVKTVAGQGDIYRMSQLMCLRSCERLHTANNLQLLIAISGSTHQDGSAHIMYMDPNTTKDDIIDLLDNLKPFNYIEGGEKNADHANPSGHS